MPLTQHEAQVIQTIKTKTDNITGGAGIAVSHTPYGVHIYATGNKSSTIINQQKDTTEDEWFKITGHTQDGSNKRWTYTATKMIKTGAGYTGWYNNTIDTSTYNLFNTIEIINGSSGLYGNGVNSSHIPATMDIQPVPNNVIVKSELHTVIVADAPVYEWWFSYANGIDGTCE